MLVAFVGTLASSAEAQAAYAVVHSQLFTLVSWPALGLMSAVSVIAGQNLGARRADRAVRATWIAGSLGALVAAGASLLFVAIPGPLIGLFGLRDPTVVALGTELLKYLAAVSVCVIVAQVCLGALQAAKDTLVPLWISIASLIALPLLYCVVRSRMGPLQPSDVWTALAGGYAARAVLSILRFQAVEDRHS